MIELKNVSFSYGNGRLVLRNINLKLLENACVFIGPNGSGKTTLLKVISLIYKPLKGEILFNGVNPWESGRERLYEFRRKIIYVHEKPIFFRGTILENLIFPLTIRGVSREEAEGKVIDLLRRYDLERFAYRKRNQLSSGEAQLLSIIRALAVDPQIIALDEPTANLDQERREVLADILYEKIREGKTLLVSTHDMVLAAEIGAEIYLMNNGEIVEKLHRMDLIQTIMERFKRIGF